VYTQLTFALLELPSVQTASSGQAEIDAVMIDQFPPRSRRTVRREARRSPHDHHAHVRPHAHAIHISRDLFVETDAGVIALGDDVGQAVVNDDLDLDLWVRPQELR
jgi:hypothetical protein